MSPEGDMFFCSLNVYAWLSIDYALVYSNNISQPLALCALCNVLVDLPSSQPLIYPAQGWWFF